MLAIPEFDRPTLTACDRSPVQEGKNGKRPARFGISKHPRIVAASGFPGFNSETQKEAYYFRNSETQSYRGAFERGCRRAALVRNGQVISHKIICEQNLLILSADTPTPSASGVHLGLSPSRVQADIGHSWSFSPRQTNSRSSDDWVPDTASPQ